MQRTGENELDRAQTRLLGMVQGGDCLTRIGGEVVFVPLGIPGEEVVVEIVHRKSDYARARIVDVVDPSPFRTEPLCRHFGRCGGCQLQHVQYDHQLELKRQIVQEQLRRLGGLERAEVLPTIPADSPWGYRNHARFSVKHGQLGFVRPHSRAFEPVDHCQIMHPSINEQLARLQGAIKRRLHQVAIRIGTKTDQVLVQPALLSHELSEPTGQSFYEEELLGHRFRIGSNSFFQVNTPQAERLVSTVVDWLDPRGTEFVLDVYCGVGTFGLILAGRVARVIGIEESLDAINNAEHNARGIDNIQFIHGPAERVLPKQREPVDGVIIDPPRAGCRPEVVEALIRLSPGKIVYVSCDPATLARDLRQFCAAGYALRAVQPIDMFPQTQHVECVVLMENVNNE